jgi:hypothetical protein
MSRQLLRGKIPMIMAGLFAEIPRRATGKFGGKFGGEKNREILAGYVV